MLWQDKLNFYFHTKSLKIFLGAFFWINSKKGPKIQTITEEQPEQYSTG